MGRGAVRDVISPDDTFDTLVQDGHSEGSAREVMRFKDFLEYVADPEVPRACSWPRREGQPTSGVIVLPPEMYEYALGNNDESRFQLVYLRGVVRPDVTS